MTDPVPVIAIDGPSGSGKGTIARQVAAALGWHLLDSGALYRLTALAADRHGVSLQDPDALADLARTLDVRFGSGADGGELIWLDGQPIHDMNIDEVTATDLLAMEIYRGGTQMPPQWARNSCGLIIVWTKEGPIPEEEG